MADDNNLYLARVLLISKIFALRRRKINMMFNLTILLQQSRRRRIFNVFYSTGPSKSTPLRFEVPDSTMFVFFTGSLSFS